VARLQYRLCGLDANVKWFIVFSSFVMVMLAFLGFTDIGNSLPLNDKLLHFLCLGIATGVLFWVFDVDEDSRRIWFWRNAPMIITGVICFFFGGIVSEIVQSMLPYKHFQIGDVIANLAGSGCGLTVSYYLERHYRHRREISRLYQPVGAADELSDEEEDGTLLPVHQQQRPYNKSTGAGGIRLGNVWDDELSGEEIFAIADDDDISARLTPAPGSAWGGSSPAVKPTAPRIVVTAPSVTSLPRLNHE